MAQPARVRATSDAWSALQALQALQVLWPLNFCASARQHTGHPAGMQRTCERQTPAGASVP